MQKAIEIKACSCGGLPMIYKDLISELYVVACQERECKEIVIDEDEYLAIEEWNKRHI